METRYIITAINKDGVRENIFANGRTFKRKGSTKRHYDYFTTYFFATDVRVEEVIVETDEEKIQRLESEMKAVKDDLDTATSLILGFAGSSDRIHRSDLFEIHEIRNKYKLS